MAKGSKGFGGYEEAMEMRDIINEMVRISLDSNRPAPTYARVYTIDGGARTCMVVINGDTVAVKATCGSIIPSAVDQIVRLEGPPGARYIADVLGPDVVEASTFSDSPWQACSLGSGVTNISSNPLRYRVVNDRGSRKVQLRGAANVTSAVTTLFTLPAGIWRSAATQLLVSRNITGGAHAATINVGTNGVHVLDGKTTGVQGTSTANSTAVETGISGVDINHSHKFLNTAASASGDQGFGNTDSYRNPDWGVKTWSTANTTSGTPRSNHSHTVNAHAHGLTAVTTPSSVYLDGVEYFL